MAEDLLILKLLKVPVLVIKFLAKSFSILTYLPNYFIFLIFDAIIFNQSLVSSLLIYLVSWPLRLVSLVLIIAIFCAEFYLIYTQLQIQSFHWGFQILILITVIQICLILMRKGYLTMIKKFNPKKLKSPAQHATELYYFFIDLMSLFLWIVDIMMIVNIKGVLNYKYDKTSKSHYRFLFHCVEQFRVSQIIIIKFYYVKIFFRIFPWRYLHSIKHVQKEQQLHNVLSLYVLLTMIYWQTIIDLIFLSIFGVYCYYIHPRKELCWLKTQQTHRLYRVVLWFLYNNTIQIVEIILLILCLPFKFSYSIQILSKIKNSPNYKRHFVSETALVIKLTFLKIPSLFCQLFVFLSIYKYKRMKNQLLQSKIPIEVRFSNELQNLNQYPDSKQKFIQTKQKYYSRQYIAFRCFGSLCSQLMYFPIIILNTICKLHNLYWLKFILDDNYDMRKQYVIDYLQKNFIDAFYLVPAVILTIIVGVYDPLDFLKLFKQIRNVRNNKKRLVNNLIKFQQNTQNISKALIFYTPQQAIIPKILDHSFKKIKSDLFLIPLFLTTRLTFFPLMGCPNPKSSVQLFQFLLMIFYIKRVKKSKHYDKFVQYFKQDQASGAITKQSERLKFWKFAHKSCRHRITQYIIRHLMPKRRATRVLENVKPVKGLSNISNQYWTNYYKTLALLKAQIIFIIEMIVTIFGVVILLPLTLWRMPSFLIIFKEQKYKKKTFFTILFKIYKQMIIDLLMIVPQICALFFSPISHFRFYRKNIYCYNFVDANSQNKLKRDLQRFEKSQKLKSDFLIQMSVKKFEQLITFIKIFFIKTLWIRKRDLNQELQQSEIKVRTCFIKYIQYSQKIPTLNELYQKTIPQLLNQNVPEMSKLDQIVQRHYLVTIQDLPYLMLMIFVFTTLPWRFFYIKKALLLMRQDKINRKQFRKLLKKISQDYKCLFLYIILLLSIVKTKRTLILIIRNAKLNFFVGYLKYSHLQELLIQLVEVKHFYSSALILFVAFILSPLRGSKICSQTLALYKQYKQQQKDLASLETMYANTVKEGKQRQILYKVGHQTLLNICSYLETNQLVRMERVSRYMYEIVKQRDEAWLQHWQYFYEGKTTLKQKILNQEGEPNYRQMCIKSYMNTHQKKKDWRDNNRLYNLAYLNFRQSCEQFIDVKIISNKFLPVSLHKKIFTGLRYNTFDGYGPEQQWPQPDDDQQFLALMNMQRRQVIELDEYSAFASWLIQRPIQIIIVILTRFYNRDQYRRVKQFIFLLTTYPVIILYFFSYIYPLWSWFWDITPAIGVKILFVLYYTFMAHSFAHRYKMEARKWTTLHPFDLTEDIKIFLRKSKAFINQKSQQFGAFLRDKIWKPYIVRPLKWFGNKSKTLYIKLVDNVVYPLYISISRKLRVIWDLLISFFRFTLDSFKTLLKLIRKVMSLGVSLIRLITSSFSNLYYTLLKISLQFALNFGVVGQFVFTVIILGLMISPSFLCYYFYFTRWFIIFSSLFTMTMMVTGYRHLSAIKQNVLGNKKKK